MKEILLTLIFLACNFLSIQKIIIKKNYGECVDIKKYLKDYMKIPYSEKETEGEDKQENEGEDKQGNEGEDKQENEGEDKQDTEGEDKQDTEPKSDSDSNYEFQYYGFNSQNCQLRQKQEQEQKKCCYLSIYSKEKWYHFCGIIDNTKNFHKKYPKETFANSYIYAYLPGYNKTLKGDINFKLDCFERNIKFIKCLGIAALILLF